MFTFSVIAEESFVTDYYECHGEPCGYSEAEGTLETPTRDPTIPNATYPIIENEGQVFCDSLDIIYSTR